MKIYFDDHPHRLEAPPREITLQQLVQERQNLEYRVYPIEDIVLDYVDKDGNLYFTTRERG
jgi:hypothetical protein